MLTYLKKIFNHIKDYIEDKKYSRLKKSLAKDDPFIYK